ncbi:uncharacterized protein LOC134533456 [Bacillus rossius redtenbacheri]|uniref:uncharacterized protein LOC134533456 n=1 Tax=Bacillus rossius redtenbacheri TaxID=93214 RepID=UPI002FDCDAC2
MVQNGGGNEVGAGGRTKLEMGEQRGDFRRRGKREGQDIREEGESDVTGQGERSIIIVRGLRRQGGVGGGGEGGGEVGGDRLGPLRSRLRHPDRKSEGRDGGGDGTKATDVRPQRARGSGEGAEAPRLQSGPPPRDQPAAPPPEHQVNSAMQQGAARLPATTEAVAQGHGITEIRREGDDERARRRERNVRRSSRRDGVGKVEDSVVELSRSGEGKREVQSSGE